MESLLFMSVLSFFAVLVAYSLARGIIAPLLIPDPESVVLSVRNRENDIEYTLRAILLRYPKSRVIVRDNQSSDRTAEIVSRMAQRHPRITLE